MSDRIERAHLTDAEIAAIAYADLAGQVRLVNERRDAHFAQCEACRARVDEVRALDAQAGQLLTALDPPSLPTLDPYEIMREARQRGGAKRSTARMLRIATMAASFVVCVIGGIAFALPASPVAVTLKQLLGFHDTRTAPTATPVPSALMSPDARGIALLPTGPLTVELLGGAVGSLHVRYCDTTFATVRVVTQHERSAAAASSGASSNDQASPVRFALSPNTIRVTTTRGRPDLLLTLPETVHDVQILQGATKSAVRVDPSSGHATAHGCQSPISVSLDQ